MHKIKFDNTNEKNKFVQPTQKAVIQTDLPIQSPFNKSALLNDLNRFANTWQLNIGAIDELHEIVNRHVDEYIPGKDV